jgi:phenylacetaldehyde dehydrogenase
MTAAQGDSPVQSNKPVQIPEAVAAFLKTDHGLLIDGKWRPPETGGTIVSHNPADGAELAQIAAATPADVDEAVRAARRCLGGAAWRDLPPSRRGQLLWRLAELTERDAEILAWIDSLENGMPLRLARFAMAGAAENLRYNAGWAGKLDGTTPQVSAPETHAYTVREPVGVVGAIVPWNLPLTMAANKIGPAIAAGCTIVLKPAELTSLSALWLGRLVQEAGFPDGAVNIVTGHGNQAGQALAAHSSIDKIAFTGSTQTGRAIVAATLPNLTRVSLELGGKSPVFVFPDADMDAATAGAANGIFFNSGQVCVAGSRLYTHERVFDEVLERICDRARSLTLGYGQLDSTDLGPLVSAAQKERVEGYVTSGLDAGCMLAARGAEVPVDGHFVAPVVLAGTRPDMAVFREEIFGPVLSVMRFDDDDLDRLAEMANDTEYGLSANIWTRDLSRAHGLARRIRAGTVRINGAGMDPALPFGGFKQSGWGRENGLEGVLAYTEQKSVAVRL